MIIFLKTSTFQRKAKKIVSVLEIEELQKVLANNPKAGVVIPKFGGLRKIRWAREGGGKSGGFRVIYYYFSEKMKIALFDIYAKKDKSNLKDKELKQFLKIIKLIKKEM